MVYIPRQNHSFSSARLTATIIITMVYITAACKTVGLLQDFSLEPEFGNTGLDLVVWWGIGLESEERRGENSGPATHSSRNWAANPVVWRFAPR